MFIAVPVSLALVQRVFSQTWKILGAEKCWLLPKSYILHKVLCLKSSSK